MTHIVSKGALTMDDDLPLPKAFKAGVCNLNAMSVKDLEDYIAEMEAEIERVRREISTKDSVKAAAEAFFKS